MTDSFHGTCFSIIYGKKFITFANIQRGIDRFNTLFDRTDLMERMVFKPMEAVRIYNDEIDYEKAYAKLSPFVTKSKKWLKDALEKSKPNCASAYDIIIRKIRDIQK